MSASPLRSTSTETPSVPRGRLAPSPTGELHLGHARSFLFAYWSIRSRAGRLLLRLEDLDASRSRDAYVDLAQKDLEWLGLDWDDTWIQSQRRSLIQDVGLELLRTGLAYPCTCSRADIELALSAPHGDSGQRYPGTCRNRHQTLDGAETAVGKAAGLRYQVQESTYRFHDRIAGPQSFTLRGPDDDFLILRRDRTPAYHLAVVVDDAAYRVTEVVRGDDLLTSTAQQLSLYEALCHPPPTYAHLPLVLDEHGQRLAKRNRALSLKELREAGVDPRAIVGWAAKSAGLETDDRIPASEVIPIFNLERIARTPAKVSRSQFA